ncbi:MAG: hypothetical protein MK171_09140 [Pirellulales bacterium]|nr:hypothetical protein [Pirellulales bacterium]
MNLPVSIAVRTAWVAAFSATLLLNAHRIWAEGGYVQPRFSQPISQTGRAQQAMPPLPGALLAGGPAAAQGNQFMDAGGNSIVMPANYCQGCPGGYGPAYPGGYGDPMGIDFGGCGTEQCGPHYFDISVDAVFFAAEELFDNLGNFGAITAAASAPRILNPNDSAGDFEPGWRIMGRYDIGALAVLEATYMGMYDIGFSNRVVSTQVTTSPPDTPFQLVSVFSNFGQDPIDGLDQGEVYALRYESDLQSTEISYRRYWVGKNPRVSGTWLAGARYLRMTESLVHNVEAFVLGVTDFSMRSWNSENDLVGFQFGGDGNICLRQGLRIQGEAKAGIYNNRFKFRHVGEFPAAGNAPADFDVSVEGNQVAFAAEWGVTLIADILPSWSVRAGYQALYLNSLATAGGNVDETNISNTALLTQSHAIYHGFHSGIEWIW